MYKTHSAVILVSLVVSIILNSCFKSEDCTYNVFENEELFMDADLDDRHIFIRDSTENNIYPTFGYELDTTREDTLIFYFNSHYFFEEGQEVISLIIIRHSDFSDVINYGSGILNYRNLNSLIVIGDYNYSERSDTISDYAVSIKYYLNDTTVYEVDQSSGNPEDFYFSIDNFVRNQNSDCYNRNFEWITFNGTFGCRLVNPESEDTVIIKNGEFRAAAAQYNLGSF